MNTLAQNVRRIYEKIIIAVIELAFILAGGSPVCDAEVISQEVEYWI